MWAMQSLGFDNYIEPLKLYLQKYREVCDGKAREQREGAEGGSRGREQRGGAEGGRVGADRGRVQREGAEGRCRGTRGVRTVGREGLT